MGLYLAIVQLSHAGRHIRVGETVELTSKQAARLGGAVTPLQVTFSVTGDDGAATPSGDAAPMAQQIEGDDELKQAESLSTDGADTVETADSKPSIKSKRT